MLKYCIGIKNAKRLTQAVNIRDKTFQLNN